MKGIRIAYYIIMAACLFMGLSNGIRAYYIVFFMQLLLLLTSLSLNIWTILTFSYMQKLERDRGVKGEAVKLNISIYNDRPFPYTAMKLRIAAIDESDNAEVLFSLMPHESIDFAFNMNLTHRGEHEVGMAYLTVTDIFGLLPMRINMQVLSYYRMLPLLVYPRLIDLRGTGTGFSDEKHFGAQNLVVSDLGESLFSSRDYVPGDSPKRIHWKLSMRFDELFTKQYDTPIKSHSLVFIDNIKSPKNSEWVDTCCECAAAISSYTLRLGHELSLHNAGGYKPLELSSRASIQAMLEYLALLPFDCEQGLVSQLSAATDRAHPQTAIFIITKAFTPALHEAANQLALRKLSAHILLVDEPQRIDQDLPPGVRLGYVYSEKDLYEQLTEVFA